MSPQVTLLCSLYMKVDLSVEIISLIQIGWFIIAANLMIPGEHPPP